MNPQERAVIDGIFERLRNVANQPRDAEVERYIADLVRQQPYAPYAMAQSIYVQEQALLNQQREIEQLQAEVAQMQQQLQPPASQGGGFLSGLFGGGSQQPPRQEPPAYGQRGAQTMAAQPPQPGPWGNQPQQQPPGGPWAQQPPQKQGMGFLGTAASAAAGVAGGMMLGSILSNAFGGGHANAAQGGLGLGNSGLTGQNPVQNADQSQGMAAQGAEPEVEDDSYEDDSDDSSDDGYDDGGGSDSYDV